MEPPHRQALMAARKRCSDTCGCAQFGGCCGSLQRARSAWRSDDAYSPRHRLRRIHRPRSRCREALLHGGFRLAVHGLRLRLRRDSQCDGEVGGLAQTDEVRTVGPLVILYSDNLDESVDAVKTAGGKILKEPYAFPGGRRFHFADPSGNELAVWSAA